MLFYRGFPLHISKLHICFQLTSNYLIDLLSCYIVVIDYVYAKYIFIMFFFSLLHRGTKWVSSTWLKEDAVLGSTFVFKKFDITINIGKLVKKKMCINYASLLLLFF